MTDIFDRLKSVSGPLEQYRQKADGYFAFPELEGEIGPRMRFMGREMITWSLMLLQVDSHPEVRKADADAAAQWGMAYLWVRMMWGQINTRELEEKLARFPEERRQLCSTTVIKE